MKLRVAEAYVMLGKGEDAKALLEPLTKGSKDPTITLTAQMVWNVMVEKHMIVGQAFPVQAQIAANQSVNHEYGLLRG
jgi:hypothetical protein